MMLTENERRLLVKPVYEDVEKLYHHFIDDRKKHCDVTGEDWEYSPSIAALQGAFIAMKAVLEDVPFDVCIRYKGRELHFK